MIGLELDIAGASTSSGGFSPSSLFGSSIGVMLSSSSLTSLFQDSAGTIAANTPGVPLGLMKDLSGGNRHASQAVSASRPTLGRHPRTGRRNQIIWSQDFTNAVWGKGAVSVSPNLVFAPDGTLTGSKLVEDASINIHNMPQTLVLAPNTTYTWSSHFRAAERGFAFCGVNGSGLIHFVSVDLATGAVAPTAGTPINPVAEHVGGGWWRVSFQFTTGASAVSTQLDHRTSIDGVWANRSYQGVVGNGIYVWGAQLDVGTLTPYQRVTNPYDIVEPLPQEARRNLFPSTLTNFIPTDTPITSAQNGAGIQLLVSGVVGSGVTITCAARGVIDGTDYADFSVSGTNVSGGVVEIVLRQFEASQVSGQITLSASAGLVSGSSNGLTWLLASQVLNSGAFVRSFGTSAFPLAAVEQKFATTTITAPENQVNYGGVMVRIAAGATVDAAVRVMGLQVELGAAPTAYQSITGQYANPPLQPSVWYASTDAVDDFLSTTTIDWGTDEVTVVAALRKRSDAAEGSLVNFGDFGTTGAFAIAGPGGTPASERLWSLSRGNAQTFAITGDAAYAAPLDAVVIMQGKIGTDLNILEINGVQVASNNGDQGAAATYGNRQLFLGRRNGTAVPGAFDIYAFFAINRVLTPTELALVEQWAADQMGDV